MNRLLRDILLLISFVICTLFMGCDFFEQSKQPMGTGDDQLIDLELNSVDDYVICTLSLKPDVTDSLMSITFELLPFHNGVHALDFSTTTFKLGSMSQSIPISALERSDTSAFYQYIYRATFDSLPFFTPGEEIMIEIWNPYWGYSKKSVDYPLIEGLFDTSLYVDSLGGFVDTISFVVDLESGTYLYLTKKLYVKTIEGNDSVIVQDRNYHYYYGDIQLPLISEYENYWIKSIDSLSISYYLDYRRSFYAINSSSGIKIQTQPSKEFIIKPNKRNK